MGAPSAGEFVPAITTSNYAEEAKTLIQDGYIILRGLLKPDMCDILREHVLGATDEAVQSSRNDLFGNIQEAQNRHDFKLDLVQPVREALNDFADRCGPILRQAVASDQIRLVELAAITSSPGAVAQPVHADTMHGVTRFLQSDIQLAGTDC